MDDVTKELINYAMDHNIGVSLEPASSPDTVAQVNPRRRIIFINSNFKSKKQIPLQLAHEICHIMNGDDAINQLYYSSATFGVEKNANLGAIRMLAPYYLEDKDEETVNLQDFMEIFDIPEHNRSLAEMVLGENL